MAVPKKKTSPSRMKMRRSGHKLSYDRLVECGQESCESLRRPHHACMKCGNYNGRQIFVPKTSAAE